MPMMPVGKSNEHLGFPGTLTFSAETLIRMWTELGECVHRAGIRKFMMLNSHGGQPQIMDIVGRDLRVRLGMMVVPASTYALGKPKDLFSDEELAIGIHAGDYETSVMLHLHPGLVRMNRAKNFEPIIKAVSQENQILRNLGPVSISWQVQDMHPDGAAGNAAIATAEKGKAALDFMARRLVHLLTEVSNYPLARIRTLPPGGAFAGK